MEYKEAAVAQAKSMFCDTLRYYGTTNDGTEYYRAYIKRLAGHYLGLPKVFTVKDNIVSKPEGFSDVNKLLDKIASLKDNSNPPQEFNIE